MASSSPDRRTATVPEAAHQAGLLRGPVIGLRVLGSAVEHRIPIHDEEITIGSAEGRSIRLDHASVSHLHARIERRDHHLLLIDCNSKNGCYAEGERRALIQLVPGGRIRLGQVELVAFSHDSDVVRRVFQRYLGYDELAQRAVEDAHHAATRHRHLVLLGPPGAGSVAFAQAIHKHTLGPPWPLIIARQFHVDKAGHRLTHHLRERQAEQKHMLTAAGHGTLVMSFDDLPADPRFLLDSIQSRIYGIRTIFLGSDDTQLGTLRALASDCVIIRVPALTARRHELSRIVTDAITEHAWTQGASAAILTAHDHQRLLAHDWPKNHDEVEEVVQRLIALRMHGKVRQAAKALDMSPGSLSEWAKRYDLRVERARGGRPPSSRR
jgi:pSer/pThr/pTyr-binding forkhead associated (FHA) protein